MGSQCIGYWRPRHKPRNLNDVTRTVEMLGSRFAGSVRVTPGLTVTAAAVALAMLIHRWIDPISAVTIAAVLGVVCSNTLRLGDRFRLGFRFAARRVLRLGIVLLGFQLSLGQFSDLGILGLLVVVGTVVGTFVGTRWLARRFGLSRGLGLLVAAGYSICGASAIAAVEDISDASDDEIAVAVALVTLCGTLSIFVLPWIGPMIGLQGVDYGVWVGASVHDVGQVVAASTSGGDAAVAMAVLVKLTRVLMLGPLVAALTVWEPRRTDGPTPTRRIQVAPLFVLGFATAVVARSVGALSDSELHTLKSAQSWMLAGGLFGLGTAVNVSRLRVIGGRPLVLGATAWLLVAVLALAGTWIMHWSA
jgi:uncharacterized integral membrane protein (TIGR00698 family)